MNLRQCFRIDHFAYFIGFCAGVYMFYAASNYSELSTLRKFTWISLFNSTRKSKTTVSLLSKAASPPSPKTRQIGENSTSKANTTSKAEKLESGKELLSVRSDKNYPSFVKLDVLKSLSLKELKEKSYNFSFSNPSVVPIIHQSWKVKTLPPRFVKWSTTWKEKFPTYEYKLWTDEDNHNFVKTYFPWFWKRYDGLTQTVQKADAVRYMYLFAQGGIYADLDDECLKNFEHLLKNYSVVFGAMGGHWYAPNHPAHLKEGYVQNSFMYSVPGHPLWLEVLDAILKRPSSSSAESTTGPFMLQEVIAKWRKNFPQKQQREMRIYEPVYFNPFSWISRKYAECKDVNGMTSKDIAACKAHFKTSYVIQYHTQTWGRGARDTNRNDRRRKRF